jgi:outer membrane protein
MTAVYRVLFAALLVVATPLRAEDLMQVYRLAQANDPQFAAARADYAANLEKAPQGRALLLPTVDLSAGTGETDLHSKSPTVDGRFRSGTDTYSLNLTQPLYRRQNTASYRRGQFQANQAEAELRAAQHDLMLRTAQAYFGVLGAQDVLDYYRRERSSIERLLTLARRQFSVGAASLVDVHEAEARLDVTRAQEIAAATDLQAKREALRALIGATPSSLARLTRLAPESLDPQDAELWAQRALADSPLVKARAEALAAAKQELEKNRAGHLPTLDLTAGRTFNNDVSPFSGARLETTSNQVGLLFQLPLYQGGAVSSRVREAAARRDEAGSRLDQAKREAAQLARQYYIAVVNGIARVSALEQALASNRRALETTLLGFERGQRTGVDVLNTQRQLFATRRDLTAARYDYLNNRLRLLAAAGTLDETELEAINRQLSGSPTNTDGNS